MVRCVSPEPKKTIADPCCGSGGFFLAAHSFIAENFTLDREQKEFLKNSTFYGNEIVSATYKTALMNLYLHNIGDIYGEVPITRGDALLTDLGYRVDYVLTIIWSDRIIIDASLATIAIFIVRISERLSRLKCTFHDH